MSITDQTRPETTEPPDGPEEQLPVPEPRPSDDPPVIETFDVQQSPPAGHEPVISPASLALALPAAAAVLVTVGATAGIAALLAAAGIGGVAAVGARVARRRGGLGALGLRRLARRAGLSGGRSRGGGLFGRRSGGSRGGGRSGGLFKGRGGGLLRGRKGAGTGTGGRRGRALGAGGRRAGAGTGPRRGRGSGTRSGSALGGRKGRSTGASGSSRRRGLFGGRGGSRGGLGGRRLFGGGSGRGGLFGRGRGGGLLRGGRRGGGLLGGRRGGAAGRSPGGAKRRAGLARLRSLLRAGKAKRNQLEPPLLLKARRGRRRTSDQAGTDAAREVERQASLAALTGRADEVPGHVETSAGGAGPHAAMGKATGGGKAMADPFQSATEAIEQAAASFDPHNANHVREWYAGAPQLVQAVSQLFDRHGVKLTEEFHMDPGAGELARGLGGLFGRFSAPIEDASSAFHRAHADDLRKIDEPAPNQDKWDIAANRE